MTATFNQLYDDSIDAPWGTKLDRVYSEIGDRWSRRVVIWKKKDSKTWICPISGYHEPFLEFANPYALSR